MKDIKELQNTDLHGKVVMVRVDFNLNVQNGKVLDDLRIRTSIKTIEFLRSLGASLILISHIENKEATGLGPVAKHIHEMHAAGTCPFDVIYHDTLATALEKTKTDFMQPGTVHLFENLRTHAGEETNDMHFAKSLAALADMYVNEAFPVCHRKHASVVALPSLLPHFAGFKLLDEVTHMHRGLNAGHPFIFILGGAKFETKLPLIEKFMNKADQVIIAGALLNDILKAKGLCVGKSLVSDVPVDLSAIVTSPKLLLPDDVKVKTISGTTSTKKIGEVEADDIIVDVGESLVDKLAAYIDHVPTTGYAATKPFLLWNGPLGLYEDGFKEGTVGLANLVLKKNLDGLVGGGDTVAAIAECDLGHTVSSASGGNPAQNEGGIYISTGGGAMIEYLMRETLPGIKALE